MNVFCYFKYELITAVATFARPLQVNRISGADDLPASGLAEELLTGSVESCWQRANHSFPDVWSLVGFPYCSGWLYLLHT